MAPKRSTLPTRFHVVVLVLALAALGLANAVPGPAQDRGAAFGRAGSNGVSAQDRDVALGSADPSTTGDDLVASRVFDARASSAQEPDLALQGDGSRGCVACHAGIEPMHPDAKLSCVECHGGDASAKSKSAAHVARAREYDDERVAPKDEDLVWRRFVNPMDLRVAHLSCDRCHPDFAEHVKLSLHGTTAGHLSDGYYEMGITAQKQSVWSVFPTEAPKERANGPNGADASSAKDGATPTLNGLQQVPAFDPDAPPRALASHYADLARKECMQCHLWSEGRAVKGRVGFDGDYRGEGCAACHVEYALDGLSESADAKAIHGEPGHPKKHAMTAKPTTQTCTSCHYGDASIGLNFRGLSQLPPGAPGGPEIAGTTDRLLNRQFYLQDAALNPPDVHHERGMHCIDCHTADDVMGDGRLVGAMEHAVEIQCIDCHGTFTAPATFVTQRGTPLKHLKRDGDRVVLTSKVDGKEHVVKQLVHALDPKRPEFNANAAKAMTGEHAKVACHTCHSSWNPNFLGFHFDRNESLTQLDLLSGKRTQGRVTTQEKVFATWKSFYAGFDERGFVAPYLTGFSTMGSVTDAKGDKVLDQVLPVTQAGLSGVTMIHHQMHTVRRSARSCVECHRSSATWGLGSPNFRLARQLAFVADRRGIEVVALDRAKLASSLPVAKVVQPDVTALELDCDPLQGHARFLYAGEGQRGLHVFDVRAPSAPKRVAFVPSPGPLDLALRGDFLYAAEGAGGLAVYDVSNPAAARVVARVPMCDARAVAVQWPWAYVADGPAGLVVVDVRAPTAPKLLGGFVPRGERGEARALVDVAVLFQYSRPLPAKRDAASAPGDARTKARMLCAVLDAEQGLLLVDATEPERLAQLWPNPKPRTGQETRVAQRAEYKSLLLASHVDLAQPAGGQRTTERDYAYVLQEVQEGQLYVNYVSSVDVSEPGRPRRVGNKRLLGSAETLASMSVYNAPFLQRQLLVAGNDGAQVVDATVSSQVDTKGALLGLRGGYAIAVEEFPLDQMLDAAGRPTKDVSHAESRWLKLDEIERVLSVRGDRLGTLSPATQASAPPVWTARFAFAQLDRDGNAFLEGEETSAESVARSDRDADGRVSLLEYAIAAGVASEASAAGVVTPYAGGRTGLDGDLARLFDGVDPAAHDKDSDGRLARADAERALFAALDLDRDGKLSRAEASRLPGEPRQIRYSGPRADAAWKRLGGDDFRALDPREVRLRDEDWFALDANRDGAVQLRMQRGARNARRGGTTGTIEWPYRVVEPTFLPPEIDVERLLATFDADRDGALNKRELTRRPDLAADLDADGDGVLRRNELDAQVDFVARYGTDSTPDAFLARWDLDGDGIVDEQELPLPRAVRERVLPPR
ncbi:MAG: hypothetical protein IPJ77_04785 [Planctomycetes bacterium]|nr:hypothetical protein [Planctomycetota bacterium]